MQVQVEASSVRPPAMEVDPLTSSLRLPFQVRLLPIASWQLLPKLRIRNCIILPDHRIWIRIPFRAHGFKAENENF
jgi:hypothetical protein